MDTNPEKEQRKELFACMSLGPKELQESMTKRSPYYEKARKDRFDC